MSGPEHPGPGAAGHATLDCLGVPISVPHALAATCRHLPRTATPPVARVDQTGDAGVAALTALAVGATTLLTVHAAVVAGRDGAVVIPAASGAGKSTLTAAMVARGFAYLSDEVLALDRATGVLVPFPRPLALHATSWDVVPLPLPRPPVGGERAVDPATLGRVWAGAVRAAHVVLPRRGDHRLAVTRVRPSDLVAALVPRCFNHYKDAPASLTALSRLATSAQGWSAGYDDATALADDLADRLGLPVDPGTAHDRGV